MAVRNLGVSRKFAVGWMRTTAMTLVPGGTLRGWKRGRMVTRSERVRDSAR